MTNETTLESIQEDLFFEFHSYGQKDLTWAAVEWFNEMAERDGLDAALEFFGCRSIVYGYEDDEDEEALAWFGSFVEAN